MAGNEHKLNLYFPQELTDIMIGYSDEFKQNFNRCMDMLYIVKQCNNESITKKYMDIALSFRKGKSPDEYANFIHECFAVNSKLKKVERGFK